VLRGGQGFLLGAGEHSVAGSRRVLKPGQQGHFRLSGLSGGEIGQGQESWLRIAPVAGDQLATGNDLAARRLPGQMNGW